MRAREPKRTAYHFRGVDRLVRRMYSHLKNVSAKPIAGISAKTTGITKNAILLRSEVSQKEVYRHHKVGPSGKRLEQLEKGVNHWVARPGIHRGD